MSILIAARIARRELRGGLKGFRVFLACLVLGVAAIAAVGSVRASIEAGLVREGASLLGGDAEIELTYRFATADERAWMDANSLASSEIADFRSMAVVGSGEKEDRALTQVKAVDGAYPLYGAPKLAPELPLQQALAGRDGLPGAVMEQALMDRLALSVGDAFAIGETRFILMAALLRESDSATAGFALGPRTIIAKDALEGTRMLAPGTLFESAYRLALPEGADLEALKQAAKEALGEGHRWRDARNGAPGVARFVDRLAAFLVLVGLAGLAVGGVGVSAAVRAFLEGKTEVIATLKTLGATRATIFWIYALQIGALTAFGLVLGLALGALVPLALGPLLAASLPVPVSIGIYPNPLLQAALYGILAAAIFSLWPLSRAQDLRAAALFREADLGVRGWPRWPYLLLILGLLSVLIGAAVILTGVPQLALGAAGGILGAFTILVFAAIIMRKLAAWIAHRKALQGRPVLRLALGAIGGPGGETMSVMLSLGLGLSVLAAVGQIDSNLRNAIARDLPERAPSYYVVDIQNDQIEAFQKEVESTPGVSKMQSAPMLRGVITRINDRPAQEVVNGHWVVRGDRGITYSAAKPANAKLTQGAWWPKDYAGPPQISFAAEEAAEIGLVLGDTLTINVLGRDILGEITSFREVDFSGAGMGFVLSMNPNALAGAPHTHIATIYSEEASEAQLARGLSKTYPNITMIRVRDAIARVAALLGSIAAASSFGAIATLITGTIVLIGAAASGEIARRYEAAILKTIGASKRQILTSFALRSLIVGSLAGFVAIFAGALGAWAVMRFVMDAAYVFEPLSAMSIVIGGLVLTTLTGLGFTLRALSVQPSRMLRAKD
ncbi:MAG: ABC transporter permease [Paracoccaceae bacterium]